MPTMAYAIGTTMPGAIPQTKRTTANAVKSVTNMLTRLPTTSSASAKRTSRRHSILWTKNSRLMAASALPRASAACT